MTIRTPISKMIITKRAMIILAMLLGMAAFSPPAGAEGFTATSLGDYGNVTVMEVSGNYDEKNPDGSVYSYPRQTIAREFFKTHKDDYDFLVFFTNFNFQMQKDAVAFYMGAKNDTRGIGLYLFDNTGLYGSNGKLQGTIDMGNVTNLSMDPVDSKFEFTLDTISHEMMHRWAAYVKFMDAGGAISTGLLGKDGTHWSFLLSTDASLMYGNTWQDNGNGTFTSIRTRKYYSPLDLYLMGFIDKSRVPPMLLIDNPDIDPKRVSEVGVTISGRPKYVTIDDIIAAEGERLPGTSESQKSFKAAFIFVTRPGTFSGDEIFGLETVRSGWLTRYSVLTDGAGLVQVASTPKDSFPTNPGITPPSTTPRTTPPNINDGVTWLISNQQADGSWMDLGQTTERDTAEVVLALRNFPLAVASYQMGALWLRSAYSGNADFLSRKIEALSGQDLTVMVNDLLSLRNNNGGWGAGKSYESNSADTAIALRALSIAGYGDESVLSKAIAYLKSRQNTDGSWGSEDKGGMVQETAHVLSEFNAYRTTFQLDDAVSRGTSWLIARQNSDGGFGSTGSPQAGNSPSTVYDTATATLTLIVLNAPSDIVARAIAYLQSRQSDNGSWNQSAYQTALAVSVINRATVDPDLSISSNDITIIPETIKSLPSNIVINANIANLGQTGATAKVVLYDGDPSTGSGPVGEQTLAFPGQSSTTVTFAAMAKGASEYQYTIVVDPDNLVKESNKLNNAAVKILNIDATYDFEVLSSDVTVSVNPANMLQDVQTTAKITNKGTMNAYNVQVKYYIDDPIAPIEIATQTIDIPAGATISQQTTWRANKSGYNLPLTVLIDPFDNYQESAKTNNKASIPITVNSATAPNLSVSYKDMVIKPSPANQGGNAAITAVVKNDGFSSASNLTINFYEGVPGVDGALIGSQVIAIINAGDTIQASVNWTNIRDSGEKIIYVKADSDNQINEIREDDNDAFTTVNILTLPDLVISGNSISFSPATPKEGDTISVNVLVLNKGQQNVSNVTIKSFEENLLLGSQVIPSIAGNSQGTATIMCNSPLTQGVHQITVSVDPDNNIPEQSKDNNSASKALAVQSANLWLTEPYISPNGDGVKDSTQFSFRLQAPQRVNVQVLDRDKQVVRTCSGEDLVNISTGLVPWDGFNDKGKVVEDGQYQMQVVNDEGFILGSMLVTVDNNRSSLGEALGTQYMSIDDLLKNFTGGYSDDFQWQWLPYDSGILARRYNTNPDHTERPRGLYAMSPDGNDIIALLPSVCMSDMDPQYSYDIYEYRLSPTGEQVAVIITKTNIIRTLVDWIDQTQLWVVDIDGSNSKMIASYDIPMHLFSPINWWYTDSRPVGDYYSLQNINWSPDGKYFLYQAPHTSFNPNVSPSETHDFTEVWLAQSDSSSRVKVDSIPASLSMTALWAPNGQKIFYSNGAAVMNIALDGSKPTIDTLDPATTTIINYWWSHDSSAVAYTLRSNAAGPLEWKLRIHDATGGTRDLFTSVGGDYYSEYVSLNGWTRSNKVWVFNGTSHRMQLRLIDLATGENTLMKQPAGNDGYYEWTSSPVISPDGRYAAFYTEGEEVNPANLYLADEDGNLDIVYSKFFCDNDPNCYFSYWDFGSITWAPDSKRIAFLEMGNIQYYAPWSDNYYGPYFDVMDVVSKQTQTFDMPGHLSHHRNSIIKWLADDRSLLGIGVLGSNDTWTSTGAAVELFDSRTGAITTIAPGMIPAPGLSISPLEHYIPFQKSTCGGTYCVDTSALYVASFYQNLVADLRVSRKSSFIKLYGIAQDLNFDGWKLEYADVKSPAVWNVIVPTSGMPVMNDIFAAWTPPYEGAFYIKLTAMDKAGNIATSRKRVTWGQSKASITGLYKSRDLFSPNGDGINDTVELNYTILEPAHLEFSIFDSKNNIVGTIYKNYPMAAADFISWDGKDDSGNTVPDGTYSIKVFDHEFFFEVDNTPPDISLAMGSLNKNGEDISVDLTGHAVDRNLKKWVIEYGIGENPEDWYAYTSGEKQIANLDSYGKPIGNPVQDIIVESFKQLFDLSSQQVDFSAIGFLVGKKFRITVEDLAGNKSAIVADFLEERFILDRYYKHIMGLGAFDSAQHEVEILPYLIDGNKPVLPLTTGMLPAHDLRKAAFETIGGLETIRASLVNLAVQYRHNGQWFDSPGSARTTGAPTWIEWTVPRTSFDALRLKAVDSSGMVQFSNEMHIESYFLIAPAVIAGGNGETVPLCRLDVTNLPTEDLQALKVQIQSTQDTRYSQWSDLIVYDPLSITYNSWGISYPSDLISGLNYSFRLVGSGVSGKLYTSETAITFDNSRCLELSLNVAYPDQACGSISRSANITAKIERNFAMIDSFKTLNYYIQKPSGLELLRQFDLSKDSWGSVTVDTSVLSEGTYMVTAALDFVKAGITQESSAGATLTVDRVLPSSRLTYPTGAVCPVTMEGGLWQGIPVEAVAADNTAVAKYELYYGIGKNPAVWLPASDNRKVCRENPSGHIKGTDAVAGNIGTWDVSNLQGGAYSLKFNVVDIAGNVSCGTTTFSLDTPVDVTHILVDKMVFSPNNDNAFDNVIVNYEISKYSTANLQVFNLIPAPAGFSLDSTPIRSLAAGVQYIGGTMQVVWDGKDDADNVASDGLYGIVVSATDSCGNTALRWVAVEIDNTAPKLSVAYPYPGAPLGNIVEISGIAYDPHFQTYTLEIGPDETPDTWSTITTGKIPTLEDLESILGRWNNFGLDGKWTLRLSASDKVGNRNSITTLMHLGARIDLIKSLSANPYLFTPNNDGRLDRTTLQYELTAACDVRIEILGVDGIAKKTWNSPAVAAGAHSVPWEGTGDDGALLPDGAYRIKLMAVLSSLNSVFETETVTVAIDTTAPVVDIAKPVADSYVRNDITLMGSITDANLSDYSVLITGPTGTVFRQQGSQPRTNYVFAVLNALPDGVYTIGVKAADQAENVFEKTLTFTVDKTSPAVTIDALKNGGYLGGMNAVADISAVITEKNLDTFILRYGAGDPPSDWTQLTNGNALPAEQPLYSLKVGPNDNVPDDVYTVSLLVTDKAGAVADARAKLTVDNTLPMVSITSPTEDAVISVPTDITGTAFDQNPSAYVVEMSAGLCADAYQWMAIKTVSSAVQNGVLATWQALPLDGAYCLRVTATDKSGNSGQATVSVRVLTHPPAAPVLSGRVLDRSTANLTWTAGTEPDVSGYNLYRNGLKINTAVLSTPFYLDQVLTEGVYAYTVRAVNATGLESPLSNEVDIKIDLTGPEVRIGSPRNGATISGLIDIRGAAYSADDFKQYRVFIGQGATPSVWTLIRTSPIPTPYGLLVQWDTLGMAEGQLCTIKLEAEDLSGNITTSQATVNIDNTPPSVPQLISATASSSDVTISWRANTDQDLAGYLLYRNDQLANGTGTVIGNLKPFYLQGTTYVDKSLPDGKFVYYLVAVDQAGNMSDQSNSFSVTIDTHPPHAAIVDPIDGTTMEHKIMLKAESPDLDIASVQFQYQNTQSSNWINLGSPANTVPYSSYFDPSALGLVYGNYRLRAVATDQGQKADPSPGYITITYTDLTPPAIPQKVSALTIGSNVILGWEANNESDLAGYNIYRTLSGLRTKINTALVPVSSNPAYQDAGLSDGSYAYDVTAVDTHGNESASSNSASANIYAPVLTQPYTPSGRASAQVNGSKSAANATVTIFSNTASGPISLGTVTADAVGNFALNTTLSLGENRITGRAIDTNGNVSRDSDMIVVVYDTAPAAPTGLVTSVQDYDVHLAWNQNIENNLAGYNLYRDGAKVNTPLSESPGGVNASSTYDPYSSSPWMAFDSDSNTYWMPAGSAGDFAPQWLEFDLPSVELINHVEVHWGTGNFLGEPISPAKDFEVQVWSGYAWITQAAITSNKVKDNIFDFKPSYRTSKIRIYITGVVDPAVSKFVRISEITFTKDNLVVSSPAPVFDDMNLKDKKYAYTVTAVDYYGFESAPSDPSEATVGDVTAPAAPQNLTGAAVGSAVALNWSSNTEADLAGYNVYRNSGQNWIKINFSLVGNTASTYMDSGLLNGAYSYRLTAVDHVGNESPPSNEASATVAAALPTAPTGLALTAPQSGSELDIFWVASDSSAVGYNLYRGLNPGGPYVKLNSSIIVGTSYTDNGVSNNTLYYYVVAAIDVFGNASLYSNEAFGTPLDTVAPAKPIIYSPTIAGAPLTVTQNNVTIVGNAEPLSLVKLFMDGNLLSSTGALDARGDKTYSLQDGSGFSISPDEQTLAYFTSQLNSGQGYSSQLWLQSLTTGNSTSINVQGYCTYSVWSPDGSKLSYMSFNSNWVPQIWVYDSRTGTSAPLNNSSSGREYDQSWSPDGTKIVFGSNRSGPYTIWMKDLQTGVLSQLSSVDGADYPLFSPDGKKLGYFENEYLYILDLTSMEKTQIDDNTDWWSLSWSPDSSSIAFVSYNNGFGDVYTYNVNTKTRVQVTNLSSNDLYYPVWSSDGESIIFDHSDSTTNEDALGIAPAQVAGVPRYIKEHVHIYSIDRTRSGYIIYYDTSAGLLNEISLTDGQFTFKDILLHSGQNVFKVTATDAAGNESEPSDPITIVSNPSPMPDLVATAGDVYLYPPLPIAGQQMAINAVVSNAGQNDASDVEVAMYMWNALGQMELLSSVTITAIPAGTSTVVSAVWDSTGKNGQNRLVLIIDPSDTITESDESNNMAIKDFIVSNRGGITMITSMDSVQYGSYQNVLATVSIWNNGGKTSGTLNVQIEEENGALVTVFNAVNATLSYGEEQSYPFAWNTGSTYAGSYKLRSRLTGTVGLLSENTTMFTIVPSGNLGLAVTTDKSAYGAGENVLASFTCRNAGTNYIISGLTATVSITDATGTILSSDVKNIINLMPGSSVDLNSVWNTGLNVPGNYHATVAVSFDGSAPVTKSAAFRINTTQLLTGTITVSPVVVPVGNNMQASYTVINAGNADASGITARVTILDPETQEVMQTAEETLTIPANTGRSNQITVNTNGYGLKSYTAVLQALSQGVAKNIANTTFTIKDLTSPVVAINSPISNGTYSSTITISAVATDNASGVDRVEYRIDSGQWRLLPIADPAQGRYGTTWDPVPADAGGHSINFRATDKAGNISTPVSVNITIQIQTDITPPTGSIIINNGAAYTNNQAVTLTLGCTDTESGCAQMQFSSDNAAWFALEANAATKSWQLSAGDGLKFVYVKYTDNANNPSIAFSASITLDTTPPVLTLSTLPNGAVTNNDTLNIAGTATDNIGLQSLMISNATGTVNADGTFSQAVSLITGSNTIATIAKDLAGNTVTDIRTINLDQSAPVITITHPPDNSITSEITTTLTGFVDQIAAVNITINGTSPVPAINTDAEFSFPITYRYGTNTIEVTAEDPATNKGMAKRTVTFDNLSPALAVTNPAQDITTNQAGILLQGTVADLLTITTVTIAYDGITFTPTVTAGTFQQQLTFTDEKTYAIVVTATDGVANTSTVQRNIIYDKTPPLFTIDPVKTPTNISQQLITGTKELYSAVTVTCTTATVALISNPTDTTRWSAVIAQMTEGTNTISATSTDQAGNVSDPPIETSIVLDIHDPITSADPAGGYYNTALHVNLTANEAATIYYTTDGSLPTAEAPVYTGPITVATTSTINFFGIDAAGNREQPANSVTYTIVVCDDNNACTTDSCDPATGCKFTPVTNGTTCDDSNSCTINDICASGTCAGTQKPVDDGNVCTTDVCDPVTGNIIHVPVANGTTCDDNKPCTVNDVCTNGTCDGTQKPVDDGNVCTIDACDPVTGNITHTPIADGTACDDRNKCTTDDICTNGVCSGTAIVCDDNNACTGQDHCDSATGLCVYPQLTGTSCNDGNKCTTGGVCANGICAGTPVVCDDNNVCTDDSCDSATGACVHANNTVSCDDGDLCTTGDVCANKSCHGTPMNCNDNNVCTDDICVAGLCQHNANTATCDDGDPCTTGDVCANKSCHGTPIVCNDNNACTDDLCVAGICQHNANAASCDDGDPCTTGDVCANKSCHGTPMNCNDNNVCTDDICAAGVCQHNANTATCDDGDPCTTGDVCANKACQGTPIVCNDNNACTDDICVAGVCQHNANTATCDDGDPCTTGDVCANKSCHGTPIVCNDNNACTTDACVSGACVYTPISGGTCNDGNACTTNDTCVSGICKGTQIVCNDNNVCTTDACATGACVYTPISGGTCNDGNACTTNDTCVTGVCRGTQIVCNDNNPCTTDACVNGTCVYTPISGGTCNDGNACTTNDTCVSGICKGTQIVCNDNNACTTDACVNSACVYTPISGGICNDGNACTTNDTCVSGICKGTPVVCLPQNLGVFGATGVSMSGGYVDSYDSTQGAYKGVHGSNVSVGTNSKANGAITLSGGVVDYGNAYVGPGGDPAKAITTSGGAVIKGTKGALSILKNMTPTSDPGGGTQTTFTNGTTLTSGTYRVSSINLSGGGIGTINGSVTLYVTGSLNLSGGAQIVILPGGSLIVYLDGKLNVSGGSIVNKTINPHNLTIYGTATCSTANYSGNSAFYGVIYAPAAKMTISGGNNIYGSLIGSSVNISGGAAVHYDESLGNVGR